MSEEVKTETVQPAPVEQKPVETVPLEQVKAMLEEQRREWQARFDKILTEKKNVASEKLTIEERMAQLETERKRERIDWARKEARAKHAISDDFEQALTAYMNDDPETIAKGAESISKFWQAKEAEYKTKILELENKLKYPSGAPVGGSPAPSSELDAMRREYTRLNNAGLGDQAMRLYLKIQQKEMEAIHG